MDEVQGRATVIATAKSFLRTPYVPQGRVRGGGVDCATLILECAIAAGIVPPDEVLPHYPFQWNLNDDVELLLNFVKRYAPEVDKPQPASIVIFQMGKTFSHGAVVIDWPLCIHARTPTGCEWVDVNIDQMLSFVGTKPRARKFFDYWP